MNPYIETISKNLTNEDKLVVIYQGIICSGSLALKEVFLTYIKDKVNSTYYNYFTQEILPPSLPEHYRKSCELFKKLFLTPNCINAVHIALTLSPEKNLLDNLELFIAGYILGKYIITLNFKPRETLNINNKFSSYILSAFDKKEEYEVDI